MRQDGREEPAGHAVGSGLVAAARTPGTAQRPLPTVPVRLLSPPALVPLVADGQAQGRLVAGRWQGCCEVAGAPEMLVISIHTGDLEGE